MSIEKIESCMVRDRYTQNNQGTGEVSNDTTNRIEAENK